MQNATDSTLYITVYRKASNSTECFSCVRIFNKEIKSDLRLAHRPCPRDGVRLLEDDLAGAVGLYRDGNQPSGGGPGMSLYCLLRGRVVFLCSVM